MKIPKPHKHGNYWRIRITVNGTRKTVTASTKAECIRLTKEFYLAQVVLQQQHNSLSENTLTLYDLMLIYMEDILKKRRTHASEYVAFRKMAKEYPWLFEKKLQDIEAKDIMRWKEIRSKMVSNLSILRERTRLSVFAYSTPNDHPLHSSHDHLFHSYLTTHKKPPAKPICSTDGFDVNLLLKTHPQTHTTDPIFV